MGSEPDPVEHLLCQTSNQALKYTALRVCIAKKSTISTDAVEACGYQPADPKDQHHGQQSLSGQLAISNARKRVPRTRMLIETACLMSMTPANPSPPNTGENATHPQPCGAKGPSN